RKACRASQDPVYAIRRGPAVKSVTALRGSGALEIAAVAGVAGPVLVDEVALLEGHGTLADRRIDRGSERKAYAHADPAPSAATENADADGRPARPHRSLLRGPAMGLAPVAQRSAAVWRSPAHRHLVVGRALPRAFRLLG